MTKKIVITGIGAVTPIGLGVEGLWDGLRRRTSAIRAITRFDSSVFKSRIAGEVDEPRRWTWDEFRALPSEEVTVDIHCVTKWSKLDTT